MKIIHLSDLHFGTHKQGIVKALDEAIGTVCPDLVVVSGDFTQIGSRQEFQIAHDFLKDLGAPSLSVPGNHDVPAFRLHQRFFKPYEYYQSYISQDLCPDFVQGDVSILGLNSARRALPHWNWANGAISENQRTKLRAFFSETQTKWKILTLHHPIHKVLEMPIDVVVFGRKRTMEAIQETQVDLVLTGHVHHASITTIGDDGHQSVFLSASTALSSRKRGHENGFNVVTFKDQSFEIEVYTLSGHRFELTKQYTHKKLV